MKLLLKTLLVLALLVPRAGAGEPEPMAELDRASYALGVEAARKFKKQEIPLDPERFYQGLKDALSDGRLLLSEDELRSALSGQQARLRKKLALERRRSPGGSLPRDERFLAQNRDREGVVSLPSGVQYRVLKKGKGRLPTDSDTVQCQYRASLSDGALFDSTEPGRPVSFKVAQAPAGWGEALKLMPVGSSWQLFVPGRLAYSGAGADEASANEVLIYEMELVGIQ